MTRLDSPRVVAYAGLAAFGLIAGLVLGRVELVALAAPFALAAVVAAALARDPQLSATIALDRDRALEGEDVHVTVELAAPAGADRVEAFLPLPPELSVPEGNPRALALGETRTLDLSVRCDRWGAFAIGPLLLRSRDRLGFHSWEAQIGAARPLRVYPSAETVRTLLAPLETQVFIGNQTARTKGEGIEFADIRGWAPGDRVRSINWRATARRGELHVNQQHPERNTDVVLFLDTFTDVASGMRGTLDMTVRAATSLAHRYLQRKDRVGRRQLRRLALVAPAGVGNAAALPDRRLAPADGHRPELRPARASTSCRRARCRRRRSCSRCRRSSTCGRPARCSTCAHAASTSS